MPNKPPTVFLCYRCICLPSRVHSLRATNVFILFIVVSVFRVMPTVSQAPNGFSLLSVYLFPEWCPQFCNKPQRFISVYCQFVFLSGACATTDVGRTSRREFTLVREVRTTAVSRRLRKTDWCFYSVFVKAHPVADLYLSSF